jgi:hypothetical protein
MGIINILIFLRKKLIILYYVMDGVKKRVLNSGIYKIVGVLVGEKMEISGIYLFLINNRMKRGRDESAIESMAEAADPIILSRSGGEFIEIKQNNLRKQ